MRKILLLSVLALSACASINSNTAEVSIDGLALAALTSEHAAIQRPCTTTVTSVCVDKATQSRLEDVATLLMAALKTYWKAADEYRAALASGGDTNSTSAAVASATSALNEAISNMNSVLSLSTVKAVLASIK